jgi:hypothetical protein
MWRTSHRCQYPYTCNSLSPGVSNSAERMTHTPATVCRQHSVNSAALMTHCTCFNTLFLKTERRVRVVRTPAFYARGPGFNPASNYTDWGFSWTSSVLPGRYRYSTSIRHDRFRPHNFHFIIRLGVVKYTINKIIISQDSATGCSLTLYPVLTLSKSNPNDLINLLITVFTVILNGFILRKYADVDSDIY